jgi:SAM-dependent methyltransferase
MLESDELARLYDLEYDGWDEDSAFWQSFAARTGGPIAEFGCGTARALAPLAQRGYAVIGVDSSQAMLKRAAERFQAYGIDEDSFRLVCRPMEAAAIDEQVRLVFSALNAFAHLATPRRQLQALAAAHRMLDPEGLLILDLFNPLTQEYDERDRMVTLRNVLADPLTGAPIQQFEVWEVDRETQVVQTTYLYDCLQADGSIRRVTTTFPMRYSYRYEIEARLAQANFAVENVFGSYEADPFTGSEEKMIFVARPKEKDPL